VDGSNSIEEPATGTFQRELDFSKRVINAFKIGQGRVRASMIVYSTEPLVIFGLAKHKGKDEIFKAIDAVEFPAAGSDLGKALKLVQRESFNFSIPSTSRIVVILTDGRGKDEVEKPSKDLASKGVHILMVGVGDANVDQLEAVASGPKEDSIFDFEMLPKLVSRINRDVCEGAGKSELVVINI
jgi:collagen type VI alpha